MMTTTYTTPPRAAKPDEADRLRGLAIGSALLASTAISGFGVASAFWDGLAAGEPAAFIGLGAIGLAIGASEVAAVVIAMSITRDGLTWSRGALFALCTASNILAGHYGAEAINTRLVAPQRAPYELRLQTAEATTSAAQNGLDAFNTRAAGERAELERALEAERNANTGAVTARGRDAQRQRDALARRQREERTAYANDLTAAQREQAAAQAAMHEAPEGFSGAQKLGFAILLELLKGVMVWVTRRRQPKATGTQVVQISPADIRAMDDVALELAWASLETARSTSTSIWHERRRRNRGAA